MGEGLRRVVLATIATESWTVRGQLLTGEEVVALYHAIANRTVEPWRAVGGDSWAHRRVNRATQILRKAGLIHYENSLWRVAEVPHG